MQVSMYTRIIRFKEIFQVNKWMMSISIFQWTIPLILSFYTIKIILCFNRLHEGLQGPSLPNRSLCGNDLNQKNYFILTSKWLQNRLNQQNTFNTREHKHVSHHHRMWRSEGQMCGCEKMNFNSLGGEKEEKNQSLFILCIGYEGFFTACIDLQMQ